MCLTGWGIRASWNVEKPDLELSEFINHLWQNNLPEQHAMDALPALRCLPPQSQGELPMARSYSATGKKTLVQKGALPLTLLMVTGPVGLAYGAEEPDLAAVFLTGVWGC